MQRRQRVLVLARFQQEGRRLDALHDALKRPDARRPVAVVAVQQDEILLQEGTLRAAEQLLVDHLALAEDILEAVGRKRPGEADPHLEAVDAGEERLEPFTGRILESGELIEHHAVEADVQIVRHHPLQVVVVHHHDIRARLEHIPPLVAFARGDADAQAGSPLFGLLRPH